MEIRKIFTFVEDTHSVMGKSDGQPLRKVAVAAIVKKSICWKVSRRLKSARGGEQGSRSDYYETSRRNDGRI